MQLNRFLVVALLSLSSAFAAAQQPVAKAMTVEEFYRLPQYAGVKLSPNGQLLAAVVPFKGRRNLAVVDLTARSVHVVTSMDDRDVRQFWWVNNTRLAFDVIDLQRASGEQIIGTGLYAVDRDGRNGRELSPPSPLTNTSLSLVFRFSAFLRSVGEEEGVETDDIIVVSNERNMRYLDAYRMDTRTGRKNLLTFQSPGDVVFWALDRHHVPRAAIVDEDNGELSIHYRDDDKSPWRRLARFHQFKNTPDAFFPVDFDFDGTLIVSARSGGDKASLYRYDLANNKLGERLVGHKDYDVGGGLIFDRAKKAMVGVVIEAERREVVWFDQQWAALQKMIDQTLPDTINLMSRPATSPLVLVLSYSDKQPGVWYLFDPEKRNLERVVASRPWIDPKQMADRTFVRYKARDGLEIPAYLTLPPGRPAKGLPLVVDVHGGPYVRGHAWGFNENAQFLASRGYAVLQPDFRGSVGYGWKHNEAGWKQWGLAMQDDLNDGVQHLVKEGVVDPTRVCIFGGSYGGYAVMMGLARDPALWTCGVNVVGVTDLDLFETATWSDYGSDWRGSTQAFFDYTIGSRKADRERFEKTSPVRHASKIKSPVFMAYGGRDRRVPIEHGERMRSALRSAGVPHEYVVYEAEGHGFLLEKNRFDFYSRVEKFLAEQLK
jgi:dipeptidyl aminopeptidase/acylaminoacyl peptidase